MSKVIEKVVLKYAALLEMSTLKPDEFLAMEKGFVRLREKARTSSEEIAEEVQDSGKRLCILKKNWVTAREAKTILVAKSFPDYYEQQFGVTPHNKAYSCANSFDAYVLAPDEAARKISEEIYDGNTSEAIQQASRIVTKVNGKLEHQAVTDAAGLLRVQDKKKIAKLKNICDRLQVVTENEGTEQEKKSLVYLTPEEFAKQSSTIDPLEATEAIDVIAKSQPGILIAALLVLAQTTDNPETARAICHAMAEMAGKFAENVVDGKARFDAAQLQQWASEKMPMKVRTMETIKAEYFTAMEIVSATESSVDPEVIAQWVEKEAAKQGVTAGK